MKKGLKQKDNICVVCGKEISQASAARASHMRKHVRDGSLEETKDKNGKLVWKTTGNSPKEKNPWIPPSLLARSKTYEPRKPTTAKSDKKGIISIRCRECNKLSKSTQNFADNRFISIVCCDKITPFPRRMIETLTQHPDTEYTE